MKVNYFKLNVAWHNGADINIGERDLRFDILVDFNGSPPLRYFFEGVLVMRQVAEMNLFHWLHASANASNTIHI